MVRKIIQCVSLALLTGLLLFFSVKQYQVTHQQETPTETSAEVEEKVDCATQSCGSCPSRESCKGDGSSNATIPKSTGTDEFKEVNDDEFSEVTEFEDVSDSEFEDASDANTIASDSAAEVEIDGFKSIQIEKYYPTFIRILIAFIILSLIGIFYQKEWIHYFRYPILLGSLIYFGFILGGCPCILVMFNDSLLLFSGNLSLLIYPLILLAIIILTIVFGKIWCGWICHLGALQEFLYRDHRFTLLRSKKAQKTLHIIQTVSFIALTIWILTTQLNIVCKYDPFVSIFTLFATGWLSYLLIGILILSSLLIYRPFCRAVCPVGLILNWTSRLPFASKIVLDGCTDCKRCHKYCKMGSIKDTKVDMACIACGECNRSKCDGIQLK